VVATLAVTGWFGRGEFVLLSSKLWQGGRSLLRRASAKEPVAHESTTRIQGSREWGILWATLTESADKLGLTMVRLHINAPPIAETFSASWEIPAQQEVSNPWKVRLPLFVAGHGVGALEIAGENDGHSSAETIELVQDLLEPFELCLRDFAEEAIVATVGEHRPDMNSEPRRRRNRRSSGRDRQAAIDLALTSPVLSDIS